MPIAECCQEFLSPSLGPLLFLPHSLGVFRQYLPCGLSSGVRCDLAMLMSSADYSCSRLCGQALLCVELPEELLFQPSLLSVQPCCGPWCWLASPSPAAPSVPMKSSNALQLWFASSLLCPATSAHLYRSEGIQNNPINIRLIAESPLPKPRCFAVRGPCQHALTDPFLITSGVCGNFLLLLAGSCTVCSFVVSVAQGRQQVWPSCYLVWGRGCRAAGSGQKEKRDDEWVSECLEVVWWLFGQCQPCLLTEGQCVLPAWPSPREWGATGSRSSLCMRLQRQS